MLLKLPAHTPALHLSIHCVWFFFFFFHTCRCFFFFFFAFFFFLKRVRAHHLYVLLVLSGRREYFGELSSCKALRAIFVFKSCWLVREHSSIAAYCEASSVCVLWQLQSKSIMRVHNEQLSKSVLNTSACMLQMFKIGVRYCQILLRGSLVPV